MPGEINKGLKTLWRGQPLTFDDFQFVSYPDALQPIANLPKKYSKTSGFLDENVTKPPKPVKSPVNRSVDPSEWAEIFQLNSGDNDKAKFLYEHINTNYKRTIEKVTKLLFYKTVYKL